MAKTRKEGAAVFLIFLLIELVIIELVIIKGVDDLASEWELWATAGGFLFVYILYLKLRTQEVAQHIVDEKVKTHVLVDALPVGVVVLDEENTIVSINPRASTALGLDQVSSIGRRLEESVAGEVAEKTRQGFCGRIGPFNGRMIDLLPLPQGKGRLIVVGEEVRASGAAGSFPGTLNKASVDVGQIVESVVARNVARKTPALTIEKKGGNLRASADESLLRRAIGEIVENACRYAKEGGKVVVSVRGGSEGVDIAIRDDGAGIGEGDLPKIFDRGGGMGLYLSKAIIEAHGGTVWAESRLGMGTRISMNLPA